MRILITGSNGFIGSWLCRELMQQEGITVFGLDMQGHTDNATIWDDVVSRELYYYKCNILNYKSLEYCFDQIRPHIVFHLAATLGVEHVISKPAETVSENVLGTLHIANLCKHFQSHLIFASTSDVYGQSPYLPFREDGPCLIGPSVEPRWSYAISKLAGEHLTLDAKGTVIRFFNVTGPGQQPKYVVPIMVEQAIQGKDLTVLGQGMSTRCYADVRDVVKALTLLVDVPEEQLQGQILNIGNDKEISTLELAEIVRDVVNPKVGITFKPYPSNYTEMPRRIPHLGKIKALLSWECSIGLRDTIKEMIF